MNVPHFIYFIHSSIDGCLGCFYFGAIRNNAAMNVCVLVFVETYVFISPGYVSNSGIAGSYAVSVCNLLRNCQTCSRVVWYLTLINLNEIATCGY